MKKLMLMVALIAAAAGAQCATISWQLTASKTAKILGPDGTTVFGKTSGDAMYLVDYTKLSTIVEALGNGSFSGTTAGVYGTGSGYSTTHGGMTAAATSNDVLTEGTTYQFAILLVSGDDPAKYMVTSTMSSVPSTTLAPRSVTFTNADHLAGASASWTSAAVPEPTSGLLLLLGVAGLALKRRRA